jgi:predicted amidohydrolase YtcJ
LTNSHPDIVIYNAQIVTFNDDLPSAQMIAITDGKFSYVGDHEDELVKNAQSSIDIEGKTILPGFIEENGYFWLDGMNLFGQTKKNFPRLRILIE